MARSQRSSVWSRLNVFRAKPRRAPRPRFRGLRFERYESRSLLAQVTLTPTADNTIFSESQDISNGAGQFLFAGTLNQGPIRRALLKFDVASAIPPGAHIDSASLQLHVSRTISGFSASG